MTEYIKQTQADIDFLREEYKAQVENDVVNDILNLTEDEIEDMYDGDSKTIDDYLLDMYGVTFDTYFNIIADARNVYYKRKPSRVMECICRNTKGEPACIETYLSREGISFENDSMLLKVSFKNDRT